MENFCEQWKDSFKKKWPIPFQVARSWDNFWLWSDTCSADSIFLEEVLLVAVERYKKQVCDAIQRYGRETEKHLERIASREYGDALQKYLIVFEIWRVFESLKTGEKIPFWDIENCTLILERLLQDHGYSLRVQFQMLDSD